MRPSTVSTSTSRHTSARAALACVSLLVLTACGGADKDASASTDPADSSGGDKTLVYSPLDLKIPVMAEQAKQMKALAESKGYDLIVQDPAGDAQKQVTDLQSLIDSGRVAGAYVFGVQADALKPVVASAQAKGIPMLLVGEPGLYGFTGAQPGLAFDFADYQKQGEESGAVLGRCINDKLDGEAEVILGTPPAGSIYPPVFEESLRKALTDTAPDAEIVSTVVVTDRAKAQTDFGNALQGNPDAAAIYGQNDEGALGALGAAAAAGRDVPCMVTLGGSPETLAALDAGKLYAVVKVLFDKDLEQAVDALVTMDADPSAKGPLLTFPLQTVEGGK